MEMESSTLSTQLIEVIDFGLLKNYPSVCKISENSNNTFNVDLVIPNPVK